MRRRKILRWLIGVIFSTAALAILVDHLDVGAVKTQLRGARLGWLIMAAALSLVANLLFSSMQWRALFDEMGYPLPLREHVFIKAALYPLRLLIPLRAGDLGRPVYLARRHGVPAATSVAASALVPLLNLAIVLVLAIPGCLRLGYGAPVVVAIVVFVAVASASRSSAPASPDAPWWKKRLIEMRRAAQVTPRGWLIVLALGLATILAQITAFGAVTKAMGLSVPTGALYTLAPLMMLAGAIPLFIMGIGAREAAVVVLFAAYGQDAALLGAGLLFSLVDQVMLAALGAPTLGAFISACANKTADKIERKASDAGDRV